MKIIQIGLPKSGNYWFYQIIQEIIQDKELNNSRYIVNTDIYKQLIKEKTELSTIDQNSVDVLDILDDGLFFRVSSIFREKLESKNIDNYFSSVSHVWSHSRFCKTTINTINKFDKVIYIVRDPRDVAISLSNFAFTDYMKTYYPCYEKTPEIYLKYNLIPKIYKWVEHICGYLNIKDECNIHFVFYEKFLSSFRSELMDLLSYLNIDYTEKFCNKIEEKVNFTSMKSLGSGHMRKGTAGQWKNILSEAENMEVLNISEPILSFLNYPTYISSDLVSPFLQKQHVDRQQIEKYINQARRKSRSKRILLTARNRINKINNYFEQP